MAVLIKLRFSLPALIFISASKRQIQWNSYQYIWRGVYIRGAYFCSQVDGTITRGGGSTNWGTITGVGL